MPFSLRSIELRPDRLLTPVTRSTPLTVRPILHIRTRNGSLPLKRDYFQRTIVRYTWLGHMTDIGLRPVLSASDDAIWHLGDTICRDLNLCHLSTDHNMWDRSPDGTSGRRIPALPRLKRAAQALAPRVCLPSTLSDTGHTCTLVPP